MQAFALDKVKWQEYFSSNICFLSSHLKAFILKVLGPAPLFYYLSLFLSSS